MEEIHASNENVITDANNDVNASQQTEISQADHSTDYESVKKIQSENELKEKEHEHQNAEEEEEEKSKKEDTDANIIIIHKEKPPEYVSPRIPLILVLLIIVVAFAQTYPMYWFYTYMLTEHAALTNKTDYFNLLGYMQWVQPGLGWLLDIVVVFGERRRALFVGSCLIQIIIYAIYAGKPDCLIGYTPFFAISLTSQLLLEFQYLTVDALVIEISHKHQRIYGESLASTATTMSMMMAYRCLGTTFAEAVYYGCQAKMRTQRCTYITIASHVLALILGVIATTDLFKPMPDYWNIRRRCVHGYAKLKRSFDFHNYHSAGFYTLLIGVILFLYQIIPDINIPYSSFTYSVIAPVSASKWHDGVMYTFQELSMVCGAVCFAFFMDYLAWKEYNGGRKVSTFFIFLLCNGAYCVPYVFHCLTVSGVIVNLWHFEEWKWIIFENVICAFFTEMTYLPQAILACWCSPRWFEATTFSILSVAGSGGSKVGSVLSTDYYSAIGVIYPYEQIPLLRGLIIQILLRAGFFALTFVIFERLVDAPISEIEDESQTRGKEESEEDSNSFNKHNEPINTSNPSSLPNDNEESVDNDTNILIRAD